MGNQVSVGMPPDQIRVHLRKHLNEQRPVTLYNTYRGLPIINEADVAMVHPNSIGLIVHPYQTVCIKRESQTHLESSLIPGLVRAYPVSIDYTNTVVLLEQFTIPRTIPIDLNNSRIIPEKPVTIEISVESKEALTADLLEIAVLDNNIIHMVMDVPDDFSYAYLDDVALIFRLEADADLIQVQGVVNSFITSPNAGLMRMEVQGKAAMGDEISILAYIATREDQILCDLDNVYQRLRRGKKHKSK